MLIVLIFVKVEVTKNGKTKIKKKWREPPQEGLSANDHKVLKKVTLKAYRLDLAFSLCGLRLGWSAVIGIVPVLGDIINLYLSLSLVRLAQTVDEGLPALVVSRMMSNIMIDFALGITPVLGTIAGALYKSNSRNSLILSHYLSKRAKENVKKGRYLKGDTQAAHNSWFSWGKYWKRQNKNTTTLDEPASDLERDGATSEYELKSSVPQHGSAAAPNLPPRNQQQSEAGRQYTTPGNAPTLPERNPQQHAPNLPPRVSDQPQYTGTYQS